MKVNRQSDKDHGRFVSRSVVSGMLILLFSAATLTAADAQVEDILKMISAKLSDEAILIQVKKTGKPVSLTADELIKLKQAGASDQLVRGLLQGDSVPTVAPSNSAAAIQSAPDPKSPEDPEILGVPYAVDPANGKFLELERQNVNAGVKLKALGFGGGRSVVRFEGSRSPVRFQSGSQIRFVLRTGSSAIADPSSVVNMDRLTSAKDHREATTAKVNPMGMGAKSTAGATDVPFKATQCGRASMCFTAATPLISGEYVITLKESKYGFLFGVD